jgi:hypothetical protein
MISNDILVESVTEICKFYISNSIELIKGKESLKIGTRTGDQ